MRKKPTTKYRDSDVLLSEILENLEFARQFIGNASREEFRANFMMSFSVEKVLENASEATICLYEHHPEIMSAIEARNPKIVWRRFRGFRNVAAHAYKNVDLDSVWIEHQPDGKFRLIESAIREAIELSKKQPICKIQPEVENPPKQASENEGQDRNQPRHRP